MTKKIKLNLTLKILCLLLVLILSFIPSVSFAVNYYKLKKEIEKYPDVKVLLFNSNNPHKESTVKLLCEDGSEFSYEINVTTDEIPDNLVREMALKLYDKFGDQERSSKIWALAGALSDENANEVLKTIGLKIKDSDPDNYNIVNDNGKKNETYSKKNGGYSVQDIENAATSVLSTSIEEKVNSKEYDEENSEEWLMNAIDEILEDKQTNAFAEAKGEALISGWDEFLKEKGVEIEQKTKESAEQMGTDLAQIGIQIYYKVLGAFEENDKYLSWSRLMPVLKEMDKEDSLAFTEEKEMVIISNADDGRVVGIFGLSKEGKLGKRTTDAITEESLVRFFQSNPPTADQFNDYLDRAVKKIDPDFSAAVVERRDAIAMIIAKAEDKGSLSWNEVEPILEGMKAFNWIAFEQDGKSVTVKGVDENKNEVIGVLHLSGAGDISSQSLEEFFADTPESEADIVNTLSQQFEQVNPNTTSYIEKGEELRESEDPKKEPKDKEPKDHDEKGKEGEE